MAGIHLLDRTIGSEYPSLATDADVRVFEQIPYLDRIAAESTYDAMQARRGPQSRCPRDPVPAQCRPGRHAARDHPPRLLRAGDAGRQHVPCARRRHRRRRELPAAAVAASFVTLFGAEAAGIANPVNPLLEPHQIAEILRSRAAPRCWSRSARCRAPTSGRRSSRSATSCKHLKAIVQVSGPGDPANGIHSFDELIETQPADRLVSGRKIAASDIAAYFHTGGTTGTPKLVRHTHANQVYQAWAVQPDAQVAARAPICCSACRCSMSAAR